jgi:large subunit ribosomal protein L24
MKIHKGDTIKIITGKDKGKTGKVLKVLTKKNRVLVDGLNLYKKHVRPKRQGEKGEVVSVPRPMDVSNVMIFCSSCNKAVKVGYHFDAGKKIRICRKCDAPI